MKYLIIGLVIFLFSFILRLETLGEAGRWSDEQGILEHGYRLVRLIETKDFFNPFWYTTANDHPPFVYYLYGFAQKNDFIRYDKNEVVSWGDPGTGAPIYHYDLFNSRLLSVFFSSLSVVLTFFIGLRYFSLFVGIVAAIILATLPHFVGLSQFVDLENVLTFFFTACIFIYLLYLETGKKYFLIFAGILTGINLEIKESNVLILTFFPLAYFIKNKITKNKKIRFSHLIYLGLIALVTCFVIWPMIWFHPIVYWEHIHSAWLGPTGLTPDVFFGKLMGAHFYYYFFAVAITTPLIILILTAFGWKVSFDERKKWIYPILIIWFLVPFLMLFFHHRQNMVRYIIQFYVPMSLLAGLGFAYIIKKFTKNNIIKYLMIIPLVIYMLFILKNAAPYYLTYFNELTGGTKNVYEKRLFLMGWFGEGLKNPGIYIAEHAQKNDKIGLAIDPFTESSVYRIPTLKYEMYNPKQQYAYVMVNYYKVIRTGFDEKTLEKNYKLVYTEKAGGSDFVHVFKHR